MKFHLLLILAAVVAQAQPRIRTVRANGEAVLSVPPDIARVSVGIVTTGSTAQQAAERNSTTVDSVIDQLRRVSGTNGNLRTTGYSLVPNYSAATPGNPSQIVGYTATNTIEVSTLDLSQAGRLIDTAFTAGANRINGLTFGLRDPNPQQIQALKLAAERAKEQAQGIASGLGLNLGPILAAEEGSAITTPSRALGAADVAPATRIEAGLVEVRATVAIEAEMVP
jgi:uncharacterized protein YggE